MKPELEKILMKVQKPGRYTGGEWNSVVKDKHAVDVRFAFCFPDTYEVGMSHLGMKILYSLFNEKDYIWCERVFAPWVIWKSRCAGMEWNSLGWRARTASTISIYWDLRCNMN